MKIENLHPPPAQKIRFALSNYKLVPKKSGCYVLTTFEGDILYIGLAVNINSRFAQHLDNPEKRSPTAEGKAIWFYYLPYDQINLPQLERTWLNQFENIHGKKPVLNKVDSPIS